MAVAVPSFLVAAICAFLTWDWAGPRERILVLNGHATGDAADRAIVIVVGAVAGAIGMVGLKLASTHAVPGKRGQTR